MVLTILVGSHGCLTKILSKNTQPGPCCFHKQMDTTGLVEKQRQWEEIVSDNDKNLALPSASHPGEFSELSRSPLGQMWRLQIEFFRASRQVAFVGGMCVCWGAGRVLQNTTPALLLPYRDVHIGDADEVWKLLELWRR